MSRVAFVTGGTRGIGRAISERLKADGYKVAAAYAGNEEAANKTAAELGIMVVKCDVGSFEDCKAAVAKIEAELGPVDIVVNNAGITKDGLFHKMSPE
jgi:acetoacetyl-CoA reductase